MKIKVSDFLTFLVAWLLKEYKKGTIKEVIQEVKSMINITEEQAKWWLSRAKLWAKRGAIGSLIILLVGIIAGGLMNEGWPNSVAGLLIALTLFILLTWWTPLVAIIAVIFEIAHSRIKSVPDVALAQAKWWMGLICGVLLWQVLVSLAFTFIPYWNAPSRIPVLMLLALAMALMGIRWSGSKRYRSVIKLLVVIIFITQVLACFFPSASTALNSLTNRTDIVVATSLNAGAWVKETKDLRIEKGPEGTLIVIFKTDEEVTVLKNWKAKQQIKISGNGEEVVNFRDGSGMAKVPANGILISKFNQPLIMKYKKGKRVYINPDTNKGGLV